MTSTPRKPTRGFAAATRLLAPTLLLLGAGCALNSAREWPGVAGEFFVTIDAAPGGGGAARPTVSGVWAFWFHPPDQLIVVRDGQEVVRDVYRIEGDEIVIGLMPYGDGDCHTLARYRWSLDGDRLSLSPVQERCSSRAAILAGRPLSRPTRADVAVR
jgi:hypothetical protein